MNTSKLRIFIFITKLLSLNKAAQSSKLYLKTPLILINILVRLSKIKIFRKVNYKFNLSLERLN